MGKKFVCFSVDDGTMDDFRVVKTMNRYGIKGTFNINSGRFGTGGIFRQWDTDIQHYRIKASDCPALYAGHELASHTVNHKKLTLCDEAEIIHQVEDDRLALEQAFGQPVIGLAYPEGGPNYDQRVIEVLKAKTGIKYARNGLVDPHFSLPQDVYQWPMTSHISNPDLLKLIDDFAAEDTTEDRLFLLFFHGYNLQIDGHKYGFDFTDCFAWLDTVCAHFASKDGLTYATMGDVYRYMTRNNAE